MAENKKILLLGAGGHCKSVLDSLVALSLYDSIGLIDKTKIQPNQSQKSCRTCNVQDVGDDNDLPRLFREGYTDAFITVGSMGDTGLRRKLYTVLKQIGFNIPNIIDPSAVVSPFAIFGEGIYIGKKAIVNFEARIGDCAIINTSAIVEHDCSIGTFAHIAPGSILCGNVTINTGTHVGAGSVIKQGLHIGAETMIGLGSVVLKDIGSSCTAYGNPCKEVRYEDT